MPSDDWSELAERIADNEAAWERMALAAERKLDRILHVVMGWKQTNDHEGAMNEVAAILCWEPSDLPQSEAPHA